MHKQRWRPRVQWVPLAAILALCGAVCVAVARPVAGEPGSGGNSRGGAFGQVSVPYTFAHDTTDTSAAADDGFPQFWQRFRQAVAANNRQAVVAMTYFPFSSYDLPSIVGKPKHEPQFTRGEFLKYYDKLFNKLAKKLIAVSTPTPMTDDDDVVNRYAVGIRSGESYTMWIEFWRDESGDWWLSRTDNVSY